MTWVSTITGKPSEGLRTDHDAVRELIEAAPREVLVSLLLQYIAHAEMIEEALGVKRYEIMEMRA